MKSDIEIARECRLKPIEDIARQVQIPVDELEHYGKYIAKVPESLIDEKKVENSNLILVTAITPTKAGIGKTTVSVGLALGLSHIGKKNIVALREPSLGPCFGLKGGAAGGGYAQILPMDKINLHFTGDFHAVTSAHNMIAALLDNYIYQHRDEGFAMKEILWKRVLDINDRNLRYVVTGLGAKTNGVTMESGFDITPASEIMAILCLSKNEHDLRRRIENILLGTTIEGKPFRVKDMGVAGAICVLLKDALHPNLVQTTENTPAIVHGGPFANIAHGCNSILATKLAMTYADYVVTEAGFGADLGAEKFFNIKCRKSGLNPKLTMQTFGLTVVVCFNRYATDVDSEIELCREHCENMGVGFAVNNAFSEGGKGAVELAELVVDAIANRPSRPVVFSYTDRDNIETKAEKVVRQVYGADGVVFSAAARKMLERVRQLGIEDYPVCIAKTQYSFSADAHAYGVPHGFKVQIRDIVVNCGAEMIVLIAGDILRMPGLPKSPQAERIDLIDGRIEGLS